MGAQYVQPTFVAKTFRDVEGAHHIREEETEHERSGLRWLCLPRHLVETPALRETLETDPAPVHKLNVLVGADAAAHDLGDQDLVPAAFASMRLAAFTAAPNRSSPSTMASPVLIPIRIWTSRSGWRRFCSASVLWIPTAHSTALRAESNATMKSSPAVLTTRPLCASTC